MEEITGQNHRGAPPADTLAYRIVACFGGYVALAQLLGVPERRVRAWFLHGIPAEYHIDLLKLSLPLEDADIVTVENLERTCNEGRQYRSQHRPKHRVAKAVNGWMGPVIREKP